MCLGIPMKVAEVDAFSARCEAKGVSRTVSLFLIQDTPLEPGDHVLVHVGYAIQKISAEDAAASWAVFDEILEAEDRAAAAAEGGAEPPKGGAGHA